MMAVMLHEFLSDHREELIARCQVKVMKRPGPAPTEKELKHGIPMFLDQLIKTLQVEQTSTPLLSRKVSGHTGGGKSAQSEIGEAATLHGRELLQRGFTVEQVVHDYGDLCQSITDLAYETNALIEPDEFRTFNRCLDNAIATAVTEFNYQRDFLVAGQQTRELNERLGFFAHELRNLLNTATLALAVIRAGNVGLSGATGTVLDRSMVGLRTLIDRSLMEVRMTAGLPVRHCLFSLADMIAEIKMSASLEAHVRECVLVVSEVDPELALDADRDILLSAIGNLLQNAFKFTDPGGEVSLSAYAVAGRVIIDVEDNGPGLPPETEKMFQPFTQGSEDHSGLGLGLAISRKGVEANGGLLTVVSTPGRGCVFTIDLPRHDLSKLIEPQPVSPSSDA